MLIFGANAISAKEYTVQKGDTLSKIVEALTDHSEGPLYGETGRLAKVMKNNKSIFNENKIFQGDVISLGLDQIMNITRKNQIITETKREIAQETSQPVEKKEIAETGNSFSTLKAISEFSYIKLDELDRIKKTRGILYSNLSPALSLSWSQKWSNKFNNVFKIRIQKLEFKNGPNYKIINNSKTKSELKLGLGYQLSKNFKISTNLALEQEPLYRAIGKSTYSIDKVLIPKTNVEISYRFLQEEKLSATFWGSYGITHSFKEVFYQGSAGKQIKLSLEVIHKFDSFAIATSAFGKQVEIDIKPIDFKSQEFGLSLGIEKEFW